MKVLKVILFCILGVILAGLIGLGGLCVVVGMFGMLTGTASTGIVLLRELDPEFETPVSDNMIYQNFPAIVFGLPLMLIAAQAPVNPVMIWLIALAFFVVLNIILFRKQILGIFKKKK